MSLQNDADAAGGKTVRWTVLSGEGHGSGKNDARLRVNICLPSANPFGALAQLGERLICIQEVIGSIPIGSTKIPAGFWLRLSFVEF